MTGEEFAKLLPEKASVEAERECLAEVKLGELCIYTRVSAGEIADEGDLWLDEPPLKGWAARCKCSACGESWYAGFSGGSIVATANDAATDDNAIWPGFVREEEPNIVRIKHHDEFPCPLCGNKVMAVAKSKWLNHASGAICARAETIEGETTIVYYYAEKRVDVDGLHHDFVVPELAVELPPKGRARAYHRKFGYWQKYSTFTVCEDFRVIHRVGDWGRDFAGETAEKAGLRAYLDAGGNKPGKWLWLYATHPLAENLIKSPAAQLIKKAIAHDSAEKWRRELNSFCDWTKVRPNEMLGVEKEKLAIAGTWSIYTYEAWRLLEKKPGQEEQFTKDVKQFGLEAIREVERRKDGEKLKKYLRRQSEKRGLDLRNSWQTYQDYKRMARVAEKIGCNPFSDYPYNLREEHDNLVQLTAKIGKPELYTAFQEICEKWKELEWSDGKICTMLPRCDGDLQMEGQALRHCVGHYGTRHINGNLIIFVRHARRPERSWFTLNISVKGDKWREIQLHGHHNEYDEKRKRHWRIPKEVREFVNRWEREVLDPCFKKVKRKEKKTA